MARIASLTKGSRVVVAERGAGFRRSKPFGKGMVSTLLCQVVLTMSLWNAYSTQ